jgi:hypothetical protein
LIKNGINFSFWGILGLTYSTPNDIGSAIFEEAIKQRVLDHPVFSIYLRKCPQNKKECSDAGYLSLGTIDSDNCGPIIDWVKVKEGASDWEFVIQGSNLFAYFESTF